jgi:hypothetical protein
MSNNEEKLEWQDVDPDQVFVDDIIQYLGATWQVFTKSESSNPEDLEFDIENLETHEWLTINGELEIVGGGPLE